jgi:hypothetical protein
LKGKPVNYKHIAMFLGGVTVAFLVGTLIGLPLLYDKKNYELGIGEQKTINIKPVQEPLPYGGNIEGDMVWWENKYARLEVQPHTSTELVQHTQYANITWNWTDTNVDLAFRFNNTLDTNKCDIWLWQNISHDVTVDNYGWKTKNYTLYNISNFQLITEPSSVTFGDIPSDYYANGNVSTLDEFGWYEWGNINIGFDSWEWQNPEQTICNLTYTYWGVTGNHVEQQYWYDWNSKKDNFQHTTYNNKHYYYIQNIPMVQNQNYKVKWTYNQPLIDGQSSGKWELMAKRNIDSIQVALDTGRYVMIDPWWNSNYKNNRMITVDNTYIDNDLVNFPLLVVLDNTSGDYWFNSDGGDIAFVNIDNESQFFHEVEDFDNSGKSYCWVNISEHMSDSNKFKFNVYYNNSAATTLHYQPEDVWDSDYELVLHMNQSSATAIDDSTNHNNDVTGSGGSPVYDVTGIAGDAVDFEEDSSEWLKIPDSNSLDITTDDFTLEAWVEPDAQVDESETYIGRWGTGNAERAYVLQGASTDQIWSYVTENGGWGAGFRSWAYSDENDMDAGSWNYLVATFTDDDEQVDIFLDGTDVTKSRPESTASSVFNSDRPCYIGCGESNDDTYHRFADGYLDEIRISSIVRNASWLKATYNSVKQTAGFVTIGDEQTETPSWSNTAPVNTVPNPTDGATGVAIPPANFSIYVSDLNTINQTMNVTFRTNESGSWLDAQTNSSVVNGTYYLTNKSWVDSNGTKYWWSVNTSDGEGGWDNDTYSFTTEYLFNLYYSYEDNAESNYKIQFASSNDLLTWVNSSNNPIIEPDLGSSWDSDRLVPESLVEFGDYKYLIYHGYEDGVAGYQLGIIRATTYDNSSWEKESNNPVVPLGSGWEADNTDHSTLVVKDDAYWVHYIGDSVSTYAGIGIAWLNESDGGNLSASSVAPWDCESHTYSGNPIEYDKINRTQDVDIGYYNNYYYMIISHTKIGDSDRNIYLIKSNNTNDLYNWTRQNMSGDTWNPIISKGSGGSWEDTWVSYCSFLKDLDGNIATYDGKFWIMYTGNDGTHWNLGLASATDIEGEWTKHGSNPLSDFSGDDKYHNPVLFTTVHEVAWHEDITGTNGSYYNQTSFQEDITDINGTYYNSTSWTEDVTGTNGSYYNVTVWEEEVTGVNGSYFNTTSFQEDITGTNGTYYNASSWTEDVIGTNGTYYNTTVWEEEVTGVNGSYYNVTEWVTEITGTNGSYYNQSLWIEDITGTNGTYYNASSWTEDVTGVNGSYYNTTVWEIEITGINGSYYNQSSWTIDITGTNGTYYNASSWTEDVTGTNGTYYNVTVWEEEVTGVNGTYYNISTLIWYEDITGINGSYYNVTPPAAIVVTNIYPSNSSTSIPLQPVLYATFNSTDGEDMNVSWYYGTTLDTCTNLLGSDSTFSNGTQSELNFNASSRSTEHFWRMFYDDGDNFFNQTFSFTTEGEGGGGTMPRSSLWLAGVLFGAIGIVFAFIFKTKTGGKDKYEKRKRKKYRY